MQTLPIQTQELQRKGVNEEDLQQQGYSLLLWQKRAAQNNTDSWSDFLFHYSSRLQSKAFTVYCEFEPPLGHFPFMCTANEFNNCKSGRGWGGLRSMTASSGLHLHFWHMCEVHPDQTLFTAHRDHRNCLHHVENVLNWLLPRTKFLCKTLWKGYVLSPCAEQQPELEFPNYVWPGGHQDKLSRSLFQPSKRTISYRR